MSTESIDSYPNVTDVDKTMIYAEKPTEFHNLASDFILVYKENISQIETKIYFPSASVIQEIENFIEAGIALRETKGDGI